MDAVQGSTLSMQRQTQKPFQSPPRQLGSILKPSILTRPRLTTLSCWRGASPLAQEQAPQPHPGGKGTMPSPSHHCHRSCLDSVQWLVDSPDSCGEYLSLPTDQKPGLVQRQHTLRRLYQRQVSSGACMYAGFRPLARFRAGLQIFTFRSHLKQTEQMIQVDDRCHMQQPPHQDSPTIEARPQRHGPPSHLTQYACAYSTQILIRTVMQAALEC